MKLSSCILAFSLLIGGVEGEKTARSERRLSEMREKRQLHQEFMHAMHGDSKVAAAMRKGRSEKKQQELYKNLLSHARKLDQNQNYNNQNGQDDAYMNYGEDIPFDMTARAFKYSGCAAIKSYDEEMAAENGNPMVIDTYAVFRLCPADSCNKYSMTGCGKNYGEYAVEMKTYLGYILAYYESRYDDYCDYCEPCDYDYQVEAKAGLQDCYDELNEQEYANNQQAQQQAWQDYYSANGGDMDGYNSGGNSYNAYNNGNGFNSYNQYYNGQNHNGNSYYSNSNSNSGNNYNNYGNRKLENNNGAYGYYDDNGQWVESNNDGGYWGSDGVWYDDAEGEYQNGMVRCEDGSWCDECEAANEQEYSQCDDYICNDYYTYCSDLYGEQNDFDVYDFLECQEYQNEYGQLFYIAPHCGSNHHTVSLGIFSDENCVNYIGETVSLASVLGYQYKDTDLFKIPKDCISCDGTEDYDEQNQGEGRYGDYVTSPATDEDGVVAVCSALYNGAAQCNKHMSNYEAMSVYMTQTELARETMYCSFIDNIIYGAYNEQGEVVLKREEFDFNDWKNPQQYKKLKMPASQAIGLALSVLAVVALSATAIFTQRSLTRQSTPWKPKRGDMGSSNLSRQNSGIGMARSRSGPGTAPLI